ncbi:hypothetical protein EDB86DRAFT_3103594 [Lactarius hatsudake]|nr:hypothetical protein EDB86DRAFT_3103594 [Lactarius hatsudake]
MSSDAPDPYPDNTALIAYLSPDKQIVYDDLFVGILYGIYIVLYITSVHVLL